MMTECHSHVNPGKIVVTSASQSEKASATVALACALC